MISTCQSGLRQMRFVQGHDSIACPVVSEPTEFGNAVRAESWISQFGWVDLGALAGLPLSQNRRYPVLGWYSSFVMCCCFGSSAFEVTG
jgi:hypothetical protein